MDENLELEQELEEEYEVEDVEDSAEDEEYEVDEDLVDESDNTDDEELEYDEDGNVIEAVSNDDEAAAQVEEREINVTDTDTAPKSTVPDKYTEREAILMDALEAMGIECKDIDDGLVRLAADAKQVTVEKYLEGRKEARKTEEAQRVYREVMMQRMINSDLNELHSLFPETKDITKFENIPSCKRYAELRDMGLSVKEAYSAANSDSRREAIANSVKQQTINASKSHLKSNVPIASRDTSVKITRGEMEQMRELFPEKSDKELIALYKKTK